MKLPRTTPTIFCKAFIQRELNEYKKNRIWMSYWSVMQSLIDRADELTRPFNEIIENFGYSDFKEGVPPYNTYVWLVLEHIWFSASYKKEKIMEARADFKELKEIQDEIVDLAFILSSKLKRQSELYETSGFSKPNYQFLADLFEQASEQNYLYKAYVADKFKALTRQYDLKYWPSKSDLLDAIARFEDELPQPSHCEFPDNVIVGRESDVKDFVIVFDSKFDETNGLPQGFRFTNNAMADIINVVLDLPTEKLTSGDAIRIVRNRYKEKTS